MKILIPTLLCATLGLAPFTPQPHIWEKLNRISQDIHSMAYIDWFDLILHGSPWLYLIYSLYQMITLYKKNK